MANRSILHALLLPRCRCLSLNLVPSILVLSRLSLIHTPHSVFPPPSRSIPSLFNLSPFQFITILGCLWLVGRPRRRGVGRGRWFSGRNETLNLFPLLMPVAGLANSHI